MIHSLRKIKKQVLYIYAPWHIRHTLRTIFKLPSTRTVCPHSSYFFENCGGLKKTHAYKRCELCIYEKHNILARFPHPGGGPGQGGAFSLLGAVNKWVIS
ncbi:hypothetical protein CSX01_12700 [Pseudobutyrivibrio ruminis]|uniref:Uncharacterized protein n=1 Tax=Pseudobutyrivibrio ruminis TaxID=46206 RepID=A0A2G3DSY0_9FIRM|nr:hypothetical protein CSX01_12700 [Pseudobutyrivibrio ruminis]